MAVGSRCKERSRRDGECWIKVGMVERAIPMEKKPQPSMKLSRSGTWMWAFLTETWHRSDDDISLRLAAPSSYSAVDAVRKSDPNHGGIVVIHSSRYRCVRVPLPDFTSFEGLCVRLMSGVSLSSSPRSQSHMSMHSGHI